MSWEFVPVNGPYGGVTEGPAWDGSGLLFTHIPASQIMRFDPDTGTASVYRNHTNHANGLSFDGTGRLFACEGGRRRVVRYDGDDTIVLSDGFEGRRHNIPNDLAIDLQDRIWFTDPFYEGSGGPWSEDRSNREVDHDSVYRLDPQADGTYEIHRGTFDTTRPNGVLLSLNQDVLYVAQSGKLQEEKRELRAYPILADGGLGEHTVMHDFGSYRGIDGMCLDVDGNIIATAGFLEAGPGPMIYVFSPSGEVLETHPMTVDRPTNCTFGGQDLDTLYVTTVEGYLLRAYTERQGKLNYPSSLN